MTDTFELRIERPAFGGAGLARMDGRIVFVDGGLPGSLVEAKATKQDKGCVHAVALRVLEPSPHAVKPFCPHFGACGGCTWQDADYAAQLDWKRQIVEEQLRRLGRIETEVAPTVASPKQRGYRNKMEFAFGPGPRLGLRRRYEPGRIEEVTQCGLMDPKAMRILDAVRGLAVGSALPTFNARTGDGVWRHLVLRRSEASGKWLAMLIVGPRAPQARIRPLAQELLDTLPDLAGVVLGVRRDRGDYAIPERRAWTLGDGFLEEELDGLHFQVSAEAFFQTNTDAAALLYARAVEAAKLTGAETVWDLYCGTGGLSLFLARKARAVTGFEVSREAVLDARENASANGLLNCAFVPGDLKDSVRREDALPPDVVVLDPPRAGLHPESAPALLELAAPRMVYVSCNPSTLARDLSRLGAGYAVRRVTPVDLFPHTPHVECVAELEAR